MPAEQVPDRLGWLGKIADSGKKTVAMQFFREAVAGWTAVDNLIGTVRDALAASEAETARLRKALTEIAELTTWCNCVYGFKGDHAAYCPCSLARDAVDANPASLQSTT